MNTDLFRQFYDYHFAENRKIWDRYVLQLSNEQFTKEVDYAHSSVRDQVVHLVSVDDTWFRGLRSEEIPEPLDADQFEDRESLRAHWDRVEQRMREYLANLSDEMLCAKPFPEGEDQDLITWQVLLHVVNHGTDHRAQILRLLNDFGVETESQDFIFYVYEHA
jgi:uncharacterized damage-inducible protein DinB